jgi:hypothetical protein
MRKFEEKISAAWQDAVNLVLGAWLALSPLILGYTAQNEAALNAYVAGAAIVILAASAIWYFQQWEEWINALLGLWLIVSPWILGYSTLEVPLWNQIAVGVLTAGLAIWAAQAENRNDRVAAK